MSNPYLMRVPFCNSGANKNTIQVSRQPTQPPQDATYEEGFPTITMVPTGGIAPNGQDMNGILNEISSAIVHYCRGDRIQFDAAYAAAIGGYDKGAIVASNDYQKDYISLVDNNTADPNGSNTTWAVYAGQGSVPVATSTTTGTVKLVNSLSSVATDAALTALQGKNIADSFSSQKTVTGFQDIFGGLTIQWGTVQVTGNQIVSFAFPKPFNNSCFVVMSTVAVPASGYTHSEAVSNSTFRIETIGFPVGIPQRIQWFAIGH